MRAVESWQANRQVAPSIQRIPVLFAAPLAAPTGLQEACWGEAIGSPAATADTLRVMQCSRERFRNRRAYAGNRTPRLFPGQNGFKASRSVAGTMEELRICFAKMEPTTRSSHLCQDRAQGQLSKPCGANNPESHRSACDFATVANLTSGTIAAQICPSFQPPGCGYQVLHQIAHFKER
jgi:hypothetical protein